MFLTNFFNLLFPLPPLGPHPDELRREREKLFEKYSKQHVYDKPMSDIILDTRPRCSVPSNKEGK